MTLENRGPGFVPIVLAATAAQLAMVVTGHLVPAVALWFGPLGMTISLLAGVAVALAGTEGWGDAAARGALAGGLCALVGIALSRALGDVTTLLLLLGTLSSAVAGALGAVIARTVRRPAPRPSPGR